jgi:hypothetical protein
LRPGFPRDPRSRRRRVRCRHCGWACRWGRRESAVKRSPSAVDADRRRWGTRSTRPRISAPAS